MSTRLKLETYGFAEYLERIAKAGHDVDIAAAEALEAGGAVLLAGMKRRAPVLIKPDPRYRAGALRDALMKTEPIRDGNFHYIEVGLPRGKANLSADLARYSNAQEYGTANTAAQPYFRPAMQEDMRKDMRKNNYVSRNSFRRVFCLLITC